MPLIGTIIFAMVDCTWKGVNVAYKRTSAAWWEVRRWSNAVDFEKVWLAVLVAILAVVIYVAMYLVFGFITQRENVVVWVDSKEVLTNYVVTTDTDPNTGIITTSTSRETYYVIYATHHSGEHAGKREEFYASLDLYMSIPTGAVRVLRVAGWPFKGRQIIERVE